MPFSIITSLDKILVSFQCLQALEAVPANSNGLDIFKYVMRRSSHDYNVQPIAQAKRFDYKDAPWFPNCISIKDPSQSAKCYACMSVAAGAYFGAIGTCTPESFACTVGVWKCETVCIAVATYALWAAEQACYCEHADCGNASGRNGGRIGGPPIVTSAGRKFNLHLPNGWGYLGTRSIYINPLGREVAAAC